MDYLQKILKLVRFGKIRTKYSHHNLIYRRQKKFVFSVDCSGLIEFWLSKKHKNALQEVYEFIYQIRQVDKKEIKRLYSFDFYDFFENIKEKGTRCWQAFDIQEKLQYGDIVAFVKDDNATNKARFGHLAVVESEVMRSADKIVVKVIDSSAIKHLEDYRQSENKGIGCGNLEIYLDKGQVISMCFEPECIKPRKVLIGRLK